MRERDQVMNEVHQVMSRARRSLGYDGYEAYDEQYDENPPAEADLVERFDAVTFGIFQRK